MAQYHIYKEGLYKGTYNTAHKITAIINHITRTEGANIRTILDAIKAGIYEALTTEEAETLETIKENAQRETPLLFEGFICFMNRERIYLN